MGTTAAEVLRTARRRSGLTLRALAERAGTSHSTIAAYESGAKQPSVATLERLVRATGFALSVDLDRRVRVDARGRPRGEELEEVLALAAEFPARHGPSPSFPRFGRA